MTDNSDTSCRQVTILQSRLKVQKRFTADGVETYPNAKFFDVHTREVDNINSLHDLILKLSRWSHGFIIRGELIDKTATTRVVRRTVGDTATFTDPPNGRQWVCIDVDGVTYIGEPESQESVKHCIGASLPRAFSDVACVYQWSASAGIDGWQTFKLHLWFWLDRPVCRSSMADWLQSYPVDPSLFRTIQPHYVACPVFDGVDDPVSERVGMVPGADSVKVPWVVPSPERWRSLQEARDRIAEQERAKARDAYVRSGTVRATNRRRAVAGGILRKAAIRIAEAGEGGRHDAIYSESAGVGNFVGSGLIPRATAVSALRDAARAVLPGNRYGDADRVIDEALAAGVKTPRSINGV